jgi:hypothetical protein
MNTERLYLVDRLADLSDFATFFVEDYVSVPTFASVANPFGEPAGTIPRNIWGRIRASVTSRPDQGSDSEARQSLANPHAHPIDLRVRSSVLIF